MSSGPVRKIAPIVFAVALALRLINLYDVSLTPFLDERELIADAAYYDMRAREIAAGDLVGDAPGFLSPFYCLTLGAVYATTAPALVAAKLFQAILGALSCVLLYLAARRLFTENVGRLAAAILAFYGPHIYYGGVLLPPTLVVFLGVLLLYLLTLPLSFRGAIAAGVVVGLAVLTKSNALLLIPAIVAVWWFVSRDESRRQRIPCSVLFVLAAAATILPVTVANDRVSDRFLLVATTTGSNLLKGNGQTANVEQSHALTAVANRYMLAHPIRASSLFGKKLLLFLNARELGIRDQYAFMRLHNPLLKWPLLAFWFVVPLGLTGLVYSLRDRKQLAMLYALVGVQIASFVFVFVLARYRLLFVALLAPFAAQQLLWLAGRVKEAAWDRVALSGAVLSAFVALTFLPFPEFPRDRGFADQHRFVADSYRTEERYAEAVVEYRAALETDWQDPRRRLHLRRESMLLLVQSLVAAGRDEEAAAALQELADER